MKEGMKEGSTQEEEEGRRAGETGNKQAKMGAARIHPSNYLVRVPSPASINVTTIVDSSIRNKRER